MIRWIGWAVYLGMSWTWCIGMFLPVLLVRDYGVWGMDRLRRPECDRRAAMGWILSRQGSYHVVEQHRLAIDSFSVVTIAFQTFFLIWILTYMTPGPLAMVAIATALIAATVCSVELACSRGRFGLRNPSSRPCEVRFSRGAIDIGRHVLQTVTAPPPAFRDCSPSRVSASSALLRPYLDATFHHVRQRLPNRQARLGFSVGFGFFFFTMILFSFAICDRESLEVAGQGLAQHALDFSTPHDPARFHDRHSHWIERDRQY